MRTTRLLSSLGRLGLVALVALVACGDPLAPAAASVEGLALRLTPSAAVLTRGDTLRVRLTLANTTDAPTEIVSGSSCLAHLAVLRAGVRQPYFPETEVLCLAVPSAWRVRAADSLVLAWHVPLRPGIPAGRHTLRVTFEGRLPLLPHLPALEARLEIR